MRRKHGMKKGPIVVKFGLHTNNKEPHMLLKIGSSISKVYIGIDVHKKTYSIAVWVDGEILRKATMPADPHKLLSSLRTWYPNCEIHTAYEAGFCGFGLHRYLVENGVKNIVVNPASIEIAANDKKKTDKRDARKIAEQLAAGRLKCIYIPSLNEELQRQISRTREQIVKEKKRAANRIKSKLMHFGYFTGVDDRKVNEKFIAWISTLSLPRHLQTAIDLLVAQWRLLKKQIDDLKIEFQELAFENSEIEDVYRSVPGIGAISARVLASELGNLGTRFKNAKALYQYTGLTPSEYSSGDSIHKGEIDRQGPARIRHTLIEVTWKAIEKDMALMECFNRIAGRRGKKKAIVAIARKLVGRIRACFISNSTYEVGLVA